MDGQGFDRWTRNLATRGDRRSLLRAIAGTLLGTAAARQDPSEARASAQDGCGVAETACSAGIGREPACVDLSSDPDNCGECGAACPQGTRCDGGRCGCRFGDALCPGAFGADAACVDISRDADNCGDCGNACKPGTRCVAGRCEGARAQSPLDRLAPAEGSLRDLLPDRAEVPLGLAEAGEGTRDADEVAALLPALKDGGRRLEEWGWQGNAYRAFAEQGPGATGGGPHRLEANVHLFATGGGASAALTTLSEIHRGSATSERPRTYTLGDQLVELGSEEGDGWEATVYTRLGSTLVIVAATARAWTPFADAHDVARVVVEKAQEASRPRRRRSRP